jgi:hypothetical protein
MSKILNVLFCVVIASLLYSSLLFAQAFGEYGRAVGSLPHGRGVTGPGLSEGGGQRQGNSGGVGEISGRALPGRLVVAAKSASLFPRQDDESEKIAQLTEGEHLVPLVESEGGVRWYMVRTEKGLVGWVKSGDVKQEKSKR